MNARDTGGVNRHHSWVAGNQQEAGLASVK